MTSVSRTGEDGFYRDFLAGRKSSWPKSLA